MTTNELPTITVFHEPPSILELIKPNYCGKIAKWKPGHWADVCTSHTFHEGDHLPERISLKELYDEKA